MNKRILKRIILLSVAALTVISMIIVPVSSYIIYQNQFKIVDDGTTPDDTPTHLDKKVTIEENSGFTFANGERTVVLEEGDALPEVVGNKAGYDIAGWYNVNSPSTLWKQKTYELRYNSASMQTFKMPSKSVTIAPFFTETGRRPLIAASHQLDSQSQGERPVTVTKTGATFFETAPGVKQVGTVLEYSGLESNDTGTGRFRFLTSAAAANDANSPGILTAGEHTFYYWFRNEGNETIKFQVYQVSGGFNFLAGANTTVIELAKGETASAQITLTLAQNNNAVSILYLRQDQTAAMLGVVVSMKA